MPSITVRWSLLLLAVLLLVQVAMATPITPLEQSVAQQAGAAPSDDVGQLSEQVFGPELKERGDREKRKILEIGVVSGLGVKNYLLNLIFGKINQAIDYKTRLIDVLDQSNIQKNLAFGIGGNQPCRSGKRPTTTRRPTTTTTTTTESVPEFNRDAVSLDIPSDVFGKGFTVLNNVSAIVGNVIQNTAYRTQRLVEALKPYLGKKLGIDTTTSIRKTKSAIEDNLVR
ncbi:uncharacterized protein [Anabrus simplex]|uniref:uncharacterized protein n=1 Tax=Anabrus simplex TaxID=316456 RepID=UPI0035A3C0FC